MSASWPTFKAMTFLRLHEGPSDGVEMDIAPTMRTLVVAGEKYFRMDTARALRGDERGGSYLWDRFWDADQIALRKSASVAGSSAVGAK